MAKVHSIFAVLCGRVYAVVIEDGLFPPGSDPSPCLDLQWDEQWQRYRIPHDFPVEKFNLVLVGKVECPIWSSPKGLITYY
jgi:hypothetical protein